MLNSSLIRRFNEVANGARWSTLFRPMLIDGKVCGAPVGSRVKCLHYINGERIEKTDAGYLWTSTTVDSGLIVVNFEAELNSLGCVVGGYVNCFGLGNISIDDGYLWEYAADALGRKDWKAS